MCPLLSPTTVPKHPIRHLHERAQQDGKLLKFVCSVSNPRTESLSPMEEAEQKRQNGEVATDITPEQAAKDAEQVCPRYCYRLSPAEPNPASVIQCNLWLKLHCKLPCSKKMRAPCYMNACMLAACGNNTMFALTISCIICFWRNVGVGKAESMAAAMAGEA